MNCQLCQQRFDLFERIPLLLGDCGHTFCSCCIKEISAKESGGLSCPVDGIFYQKPSAFKTNKFIYLQLENSFSLCQKCLLHQLPKKRKCLTCQMNICDECTLSKAHEKHQVEQNPVEKQESGDLNKNQIKNLNKNRVTFLLADLKQMKASLDSKIEEGIQQERL